MIRFLHTADWQIGKPFAGIADAHKRVLVQQERVAVIARIGAAAHQYQASFILVAGDLFDSPTPTQSMVSAACAAIGKLPLPVYVIPGNHDHGGPAGPWEQPFFLKEQDALAPNLHVLLEPKPLALPGTMLFPCPLQRRAQSEDATAWLRDSQVADQAGERARLLLAHGSTQGFGGEPDDEESRSAAVNRLDLDQLDASAFDYFALGDWHGMKQVLPKAWYAGTPELDRFPKGADQQPGHCLAVEVERGRDPVVTPVPTGRLRWLQLERQFAEDAAVDGLRNELETLLQQRAQEDLLRLELDGTLGLAAMGRLENMLEQWEARLLRLKLQNRVQLAPTEEELFTLTQRLGDPLTSRVAALLIEQTRAGDAASETASLALRELYGASTKPETTA